MSEEKVDLLLSDQPVVNYKHEKPKKGKNAKGKNGIREMDKPSNAKVNRAAEEWAKKYGGENKPNGKIKLDFRGFMMGENVKA